MTRRLGAIAVCLCLVIGCASGPSDISDSPEAPTDSETDSTVTGIESGSQILSDNEIRIAVGSPESLELAIIDLDLSDAANTPRGNELRNVALEVFDILYPLIEPPATVTTPLSQASVFYPIFQSVRNGEYPRVSQDKMSFLVLVVSPLAVLNNTGSAVTGASRDALRQAETLDSDTILPDLLLGLIAERERDYETAESRYTAAAVASPRCYPARMGLARVEIARGNTKEAISYVTQLRNELAPGVEILELSARAYLADGQIGEADQLIRQALRISQSSVPLILLRTQIAVAAGEYSTAGNYLNTIKGRLPDNPDVALIETELLAQEGKIDAALAVITSALDKYPNNKAIRDMYGQMQLRAGDAAAGREILENSLSESPSNRTNLKILLDDAMNSGNWSAAAEYLGRLIEIDESVEYIKQAILVQQNLGNLEGAAQYAKRRLELEPGNGEAIAEYVRILIDLGRNEEADVLLVQGIETTSDSEVLSDFYFLRSKLTDDPDEYVSLLRGALQKNQNNVDALIAYSKVFEETGDLTRAARYLENAVKLRPDDEELARKLAELIRRKENP